MTKTVCDICGQRNAQYHCIVPTIKKYDIMLRGKKWGTYPQVEIVEADFCSEHAMKLANFIKLMDESAHVL